MDLNRVTQLPTFPPEFKIGQATEMNIFYKTFLAARADAHRIPDTRIRLEHPAFLISAGRRWHSIHVVLPTPRRPN